MLTQQHPQMSVSRIGALDHVCGSRKDNRSPGDELQQKDLDLMVCQPESTLNLRLP